MKKRIEPKANYSAIFINGKTIRIPLDTSKPITELQHPEFYDIGINSLCYAKCPWCYTSATARGKNFKDIVKKVNAYFGQMSHNDRPFQVAIGGSGEPTLHPEFASVLEAFSKLGIVPNYTTNGMHLSSQILAATQQYCGGVAVSAHPHIKSWEPAIGKLLNQNIKTNLHYIVSDAESISALDTIYAKYSEHIDYIVLLPQINIGFATGKNAKAVDYKALANWLKDKIKQGNLAFGSNMYKFLLQHPEYNTSLYPPEILSKYLTMDNMTIYNNSFEMSIWKNVELKY